MVHASVSCFWLLKHVAACALSFALLNAGSSIAARMAMIAITTSNSISVNAGAAVFVEYSRCFMLELLHIVRNWSCNLLRRRRLNMTLMESKNEWALWSHRI